LSVKESYPEKRLKWYLPDQVNQNLIFKKFTQRSAVIQSLKNGSLSSLKNSLQYFYYDDCAVHLADEGTKVVYR